jgi:hypothetical protein
MEANLAIKADLAKAQEALAQHNISAAVETLDDTLKYLPSANQQTLEALIGFEEQIRETLAEMTAGSRASSSPAASRSVPLPLKQAAAPDKSGLGSFQAQPTSSPVPPASALGSESSASAASSPKTRARPLPPAWMIPAPGTVALLGANKEITVCDTADHYREWLKQGQPSGCRKFSTGKRVVIDGLVFDPTRDTISVLGSQLRQPLARVHIPAKGFTGYLLAHDLTPAIPRGTTIQLIKKGDLVLRLAPSKNADLNAGLDLGEQAMVRVIRYFPSLDAFDLHVSVADGPYKGKVGWVSSLGADDIAGIPITFFEYSNLEQHESLPANFLYRSSYRTRGVNLPPA